jgi:hypothetical protein
MCGLFAAAIAGRAVAVEAPNPKVSEQDLLAVLPYDLGPATIDVSGYPEPHQRAYELFMQKCSLCHTPARSIHFPTETKEDWLRFLNRMHGRAKGTLLEPEDAQQLADFLAYDSLQRKIKRREDFARLQEQLDRKFEQVKAERARRVKAASSAPAASGR